MFYCCVVIDCICFLVVIVVAFFIVVFVVVTFFYCWVYCCYILFGLGISVVIQQPDAYCGCCCAVSVCDGLGTSRVTRPLTDGLIEPWQGDKPLGDLSPVPNLA